MFIPTTSGPGAPPGLPLNRPEPQSALKQEPSPHPVSQRPVDMVQLLTVSVPRALLVQGKIIRFLHSSSHIQHQNLLHQTLQMRRKAINRLLSRLFLSPVNFSCVHIYVAFSSAVNAEQPLFLSLVSNSLQARAGSAASFLQSAVSWEGFPHGQEIVMVYLI